MTTPRQYRLRTASNFSRRYIIASAIFIAALSAGVALHVLAPDIAASLVRSLP